MRQFPSKRSSGDAGRRLNAGWSFSLIARAMLCVADMRGGEATVISYRAQPTARFRRPSTDFTRQGRLLSGARSHFARRADFNETIAGCVSQIHRWLVSDGITNSPIRYYLSPRNLPTRLLKEVRDKLPSIYVLVLTAQIQTRQPVADRCLPTWCSGAPPPVFRQFYRFLVARHAGRVVNAFATAN